MPIGIVVAGGKGSRVGLKKQYIKLAGQPMWARSVAALLEANIEHVWLVVPSGDVTDIERELSAQGLTGMVTVVVGGGERSESVYNAVSAILNHHQSLATEDVVAIHDAARPFVLAEDVRRTVTAAQTTGGALLGKRCIDTMKRVDEHGHVASTVDRDHLWHAQTPQVFRLDWLLQAYNEMDKNRFQHFTDEASLLEAFGYPIQVVEAEGYNAKVTMKEDIEFALWWAQKRWGESQ